MMDSEGQRTLENWTILDALGLDVPPRGETGFEELVETYRRRLEPCQAGAAIYLRGMESMAEARAAVLAVRERGSCPVMVSFRCDEEGRTAAGTHVLAAFIVMAGMGVYAFGLEPQEGRGEELLEQLVPYARRPLFWLEGETYIPFSYRPAERDPDVIPCATQREARFITPDVDVGETIECTPGLMEDILAAEDAPVGAVKIAVLEEDDLPLFAEYQYVIEEALCLYSDVPELMEAALRLYQGRAFYDGTGDLEEDFLDRMVRTYGLIVL